MIFIYLHIVFKSCLNIFLFFIKFHFRMLGFFDCRLFISFYVIIVIKLVINNDSKLYIVYWFLDLIPLYVVMLVYIHLN